nr:YCF48-related protein [Candidatus Nanopelagicales bacterium]
MGSARIGAASAILGCAVLLALALAVPAQATWTAQNSSGPTLFDVAFTDTSHGWAVGDGGTILATSDGGATWTAQSSGTTENVLYGVAFTDASHGWAVGGGGTILATS